MDISALKKITLKNIFKIINIINLKTIFRFLKKVRNIKLIITVILITYAIFQINRFHSVEGPTPDDTVVEQNKIKFENYILFGDSQGILVILVTLWYTTIILVLVWFIILKPEIDILKLDALK